MSEIPETHKSLYAVLMRAFEQATQGKGKERHSYGEPFQDQKICIINRWLGSADGNIYQAIKKVIESKRLPHERAVQEILGGINYLAAAVIVLEQLEAAKESNNVPLDGISDTPSSPV